MRIATPEQWQRIQAGGRLRFLLLSGVVGRGLPVGLVIAVVVEIVTGRTLPDSFATLRFVGTVLAAVALFSVSGCIQAATSWRLAERRFKRQAGRSLSS